MRSHKRSLGIGEGETRLGRLSTCENPRVRRAPPGEDPRAFAGVSALIWVVSFISYAPSIDMNLDIKEVEGESTAKKGRTREGVLTPNEN